MSSSVKPEQTNQRPSALSKWYRITLDGKRFNICDFDWLIKKRFQKAPNNLMIIEEKTVRSFDEPLSITLGESFLFNDFLSIIKKEVFFPIYIIFIEGTNWYDIGKGIFFCEYKKEYLDICETITKNGYRHLDLTPKCQKLSEEEFILKLIKTKNNGLEINNRNIVEKKN